MSSNRHVWTAVYLGKISKSALYFVCRPGKYLALDCEMVGVGIEGTESSLARVSLVNYYGAIQLDEFVRQRERVVDYRTQFSGIRESDMVKGTNAGQLVSCIRFNASCINQQSRSMLSKSKLPNC